MEKNVNGVTISIDYKIELIGLLITLSDEKEHYHNPIDLVLSLNDDFEFKKSHNLNLKMKRNN